MYFVLILVTEAMFRQQVGILKRGFLLMNLFLGYMTYLGEHDGVV